MGILIGYMRVSKADGSQVLDLQKDALLAAGVEERSLYQDQASGTRDDRPGLASCLKALRAGDTLIVWKLDRLGRDLRHLVNTVHDLTVLSELKPHLGKAVAFLLCSYSQKRFERGALTDELPTLYCHYHQEARKENQTWLCDLLLLSVTIYL